MSKIKHEHEGDTAKLIKALDDVEAKYKKLQDVMAGVAQESKKSHNEGIEALGTMALGAISAEKGLQLVIRATELWAEQQRKIAERVETTNTGLVKQLSLSGDLRNLEIAKAALANQKFAMPEQMIAAYGGVQAGGPQLAAGTKLALARALAPLAPMGRDMGALGMAEGQIRTLNDTMSPERAAGLANIFEQQTGGAFDKGLSERKFRPVRALEMAGFDENKLLAIETLAVRNQMGSILKDVASVVLSHEPAPHGHELSTPAGRAKLALSRMTPEQRMEAILSGDEKITAGLPGKLAMGRGVFKPDELAALTEKFSHAETSIPEETAALQSTEIGRRVESGQVAKTRFIAAQKPRESDAELARMAEEELDISLQSQGPMAWLGKKALYGATRAAQYIATPFGALTGVTEQENITAALRMADSGAAANLVNRQQRITGEPFLPGTTATSGLFPDNAETLSANTRALQENTEAMKKQNAGFQHGGGAAWVPDNNEN